MPYREPLPDDCPPDAAEEIDAPRIVYRLARNNPPTNDDFRSQRAEKPTARFNASECRARGLSVFADHRIAERTAQRPNLMGATICSVVLTTGAGRIKQTGRRSHYTWWPYADYDILAHCRLVEL